MKIEEMSAPFVPPKNAAPPPRALPSPPDADLLSSDPSLMAAAASLTRVIALRASAIRRYTAADSGLDSAAAVDREALAKSFREGTPPPKEEAANQAFYELNEAEKTRAAADLALVGELKSFERAVKAARPGVIAALESDITKSRAQIDKTLAVLADQLDQLERQRSAARWTSAFPDRPVWRPNNHAQQAPLAALAEIVKAPTLKPKGAVFLEAETRG